MTTTQTMTGDFHTDLKVLLPRLRVYALSLTRDRSRADDLVQDTAVKALAGRNSFRPGTNFKAWLFRIQRNEFVSGLRRARPTVCLDDMIANVPSYPPRQEGGLIMREFLDAFHRLARGQREALLLATVEGYPYAKIAHHCGVSIGTVKSRISRGRALLETFLAGSDRREPDSRRGKHVNAAGIAATGPPALPPRVPSALVL
jgi:RNA polymerase sigma-70 factor (ECF subfamily)